jgi:hypothetical protein
MPHNDGPHYPIHPFKQLPDCIHDSKDLYIPGQSMSCEDLYQKIIFTRIYFVIIILNFIFVTWTTCWFIYRNVSAQTPTFGSSQQPNSISRQWQAYSLKKRGLFGTTLGAIGHLIFSTCALLCQALFTTYTCDIYLWGPTLGFYIWTYALFWRTIRLHLLIRMSELQQRFGRRTSADIPLEQDPDYKWFVRHRGALNFKLRYQLYIFIASLVVFFIVVAVVEVFGLGSISSHHHCEFYYGNYVMIGMVVFFFIVVVPFIVWYLRNDEDAHGIRRELWATMAVGVPCFILCILWQVLFPYPTVTRPAGVRGNFGPANWLVIVTTTSHIMSIVLPLFKTLSFKKQRRPSFGFKKIAEQGKRCPQFPRDEHGCSAYPLGASWVDLHNIDSLATLDTSIKQLELTSESLYQALSDPTMLKVLQSWAVKDFSVENVLFYDHYLHLVRGVKQRQLAKSEKKHQLQEDNHMLNQDKELLKAHSDPSQSSSSASFRSTFSLARPSVDILNTPLAADQIPELLDFYMTFFADQAPLQVNISYRARRAIDTMFSPIFGKKLIQGGKNATVIPSSLSTCTAATEIAYFDPIQQYQSGFLSSAPISECTSPETPKISPTISESNLHITLQVFEQTRKEVFWNIFSGLFPKVVEAYNKEK